MNREQIQKTPPNKGTANEIISSPSSKPPTPRKSDPKSPPSIIRSNDRRDSVENVDPNVRVVDEIVTADTQTVPADKPVILKTNKTNKEKVKSIRERLTLEDKPKFVSEELSWGIWEPQNNGSIRFKNYTQAHNNLLTEEQIMLLLETDNSIEDILNLNRGEPHENVQQKHEDKKKTNKEEVEKDGEPEKAEEVVEEEEDEEDITPDDLEWYKELRFKEWQQKFEKNFPKFTSLDNLTKFPPNNRLKFVTNNDRSVPPVVILTEEDKKWLNKQANKSKGVSESGKK